MNTTEVSCYPVLAFCRFDFLKAIQNAWEVSDNKTHGHGINLEKVRQFCSEDDLCENIGIGHAALTLKALEGLPTTKIPLNIPDPTTSLVDRSFSYRLETATDYLYGRKQHASAAIPEDEQYKFLAKGSFLFVGVSPGFVDQMDNKEAYRKFLTDCLEVCRKTMQSPALISSPLYRRFIFTNVNV